jgi:hypothetical protein
MVRLGIIRHKPLELAKRRALSVTEDIMELLAILGNLEKLGQT